MLKLGVFDIVADMHYRVMPMRRRGIVRLSERICPNWSRETLA